MSEIKFHFVEPEIGTVDLTKGQPASYIRKEFEIAEKPMKAILYMTALGVYKGFFNGRELDNRMLLPGFTNYHKRVQYQTFDVTEDIRQGKNVIALIIGDGWYRGCLGICSKRAFYGEKIKFAVNLEISTESGIKMISSDSSWKATQDGPILENDLKTFEIVDMRKEMKGWNNIGYDDSGWHGCEEAFYEGNCVPDESEPVIEKERFTAKVITTPNGEKILDFGQNLAGHIEFTVTGKAGTEISLQMGEVLDENGNFTIKNLQAEGSEAFVGILGQKLTYIMKEGMQTYKSQFLISGFRYAKPENWPEELVGENFISIAVYSDLPETGTFVCSNEKINQFVKNVRWSQKSNFVDIPTDCPTRERAGWTGDINVFSETANYFTDTRKFLNKWMRDFESLQKENGALPFIVPEVPFEMPLIDGQNLPYGSAGWSDAFINIPMVQYKFYGDKKILEQVYEPAKKFVEYNLNRAKKKNIFHFYKISRHYKYILDSGFHYGEWLEPGCVSMVEGIKAIFLPDAEVATAWFYHSIKQVAQMGKILERTEESEKYSALAEKVREAYQKEFLKNGKVNSKRQCRYVRPVAMGLVNKEQAEDIVADLNRMCTANNYRLGTGFLTTYKVLSVLCDYGYEDTAYKLLENEQCPGWLYEINKGATTTWENWLGVDEKNIPKDSLNHYAPGASVAWLFSHCAGIRSMEAGFKKILIQPIPGGSLTQARAEYMSIQGKIVSEWEIHDNKFFLHVEVPNEVETQVVLPDGSEVKINGGNHEYKCNFS